MDDDDGRKRGNGKMDKTLKYIKILINVDYKERKEMV